MGADLTTLAEGKKGAAAMLPPPFCSAWLPQGHWDLQDVFEFIIEAVDSSVCAQYI